jgi:hypothetical protein
MIFRQDFTTLPNRSAVVGGVFGVLGLRSRLGADGLLAAAPVVDPDFRVFFAIAGVQFICEFRETEVKTRNRVGL